LRDAGMSFIPVCARLGDVVNAALQEDVQVIGLSILGGA
jgi:methylmalonyl-CoA mutase cobalamin-binding subunit